MRKNFLTGLAILVPSVLTFLILSILVNFFTAPFLSLIAKVVKHYGPNDTHFLFERAEIAILAKLVILILLIVAITLTGVAARMYFFKYLWSWIEKIATFIPGMRGIYTSIREAVNTLFKAESTPFSSVVFVPFPHEKAYCLGLVSKSHANQTEIAVYIPQALNLTMGLMVTFKKEQLIYIDMPFESALKTVISCGAVFPEYKLIANSKTTHVDSKLDAKAFDTIKGASDDSTKNYGYPYCRCTEQAASDWQYY